MANVQGDNRTSSTKEESKLQPKHVSFGKLSINAHVENSGNLGKPRTPYPTEPDKDYRYGEQSQKPGTIDRR